MLRAGTGDLRAHRFNTYSQTLPRDSHTHTEPLQPNQLRDECKNPSKTGLGGRHLLQTPMAECHWVLSSPCTFGLHRSHRMDGSLSSAQPPVRQCRAQPHSQGAGTVLAGSLSHTQTDTHSHTCTIYPPTRQASRMEFSQKKGNPPLPTPNQHRNSCLS